MWNVEEPTVLVVPLLVKIINGIFLLAFIEFDTQSVSCTVQQQGGKGKGGAGHVLELGNIKLNKL